MSKGTSIWIESHDNLADHVKTIASAKALGIDKDMLVGKLHRMWHWVLRHHEDGYIPFDEIETVAEVMRWTKGVRVLVAGLCKAPHGHAHGFLFEDDGGYRVHNWEHYTRRYYAWMREKERDRERIAAKRQKSQRKTYDGVNMSGGQSADSPADSPADSRRTVVGLSADCPTLTVTTTIPEIDNGNVQPESARACVPAQELSTVYPQGNDNSYKVLEFMFGVSRSNGLGISEDEYAQIASAVSDGSWTEGQAVTALEYANKRRRQGVLRKPMAYMRAIVADLRERGYSDYESVQDGLAYYQASAEAAVEYPEYFA